MYQYSVQVYIIHLGTVIVGGWNAPGQWGGKCSDRLAYIFMWDYYCISLARFGYSYPYLHRYLSDGND